MLSLPKQSRSSKTLGRFRVSLSYCHVQLLFDWCFVFFPSSALLFLNYVFFFFFLKYIITYSQSKYNTIQHYKDPVFFLDKETVQIFQIRFLYLIYHFSLYSDLSSTRSNSLDVSSTFICIYFTIMQLICFQYMCRVLNSKYLRWWQSLTIVYSLVIKIIQCVIYLVLSKTYAWLLRLPTWLS